MKSSLARSPKKTRTKIGIPAEKPNNDSKRCRSEFRERPKKIMAAFGGNILPKSRQNFPETFPYLPDGLQITTKEKVRERISLDQRHKGKNKPRKAPKQAQHQISSFKSNLQDPFLNAIELQVGEDVRLVILPKAKPSASQGPFIKIRKDLSQHPVEETDPVSFFEHPEVINISRRQGGKLQSQSVDLSKAIQKRANPEEIFDRLMKKDFSSRFSKVSSMINSVRVLPQYLGLS